MRKAHEDAKFFWILVAFRPATAHDAPVGFQIIPRYPSRTTMNADELIAEGEAIAKKCFLLTTEPRGEIVGHWGGTRSDIPDSFPPEVTQFTSRRHIATVSERLLADLGIDRLGATGLFEWEGVDGDPHLCVERDPRTSFGSFACDGDPLYATESSSFPPFEALCLHGSDRIANWLASLGLRRFEYWKVPRESIAGYLDTYEERLPLTQGSADVVVGGWHLMWPEDDYYVPAEMTYVMLTLRDAEPWYSVWYSPMSQGCYARAHIT